MNSAPTLDELQARLQTLLPDSYQDATQTIQPTSMRSAGLQFAPDGTVAWNEIWGSFCHLAMAGGPPHKGSLLEPAPLAEVQQHPGPYRQVVDEICRAIPLVTGLEAAPSRNPGWVRVECSSPAMASWLLRAITLENVSVRAEGPELFLPAGPHYRLDKEIKNGITVIAKTHHYWHDHFTPIRRQAIADLFLAMEQTTPLIQPVTWRPVPCQTVPHAVQTMRLLLAANVLSRRENTTLFLPLNPSTDPTGAIVAALFKLATSLLPA